MTSPGFLRITLGIVLSGALIYITGALWHAGGALGSPPAPVKKLLPPGSPWPLRHLTESQVASLSHRLRAFSGQKFWIVLETGGPAPGSEPERFSRQLETALLSARWIKTQVVWLRVGRVWRRTEMQPYNNGRDAGIVIFAPQAYAAAAAALDRELRGASLTSSVEQDENVKQTILIFIGDA